MTTTDIRARTSPRRHVIILCARFVRIARFKRSAGLHSRALTAAALAIATPAAAAPADDLKTLLDEHYAWTLKESPTFASSVGVRDYDTELGDPSLAAMDRRSAQAAAFLRRLEAIPDAGLTTADRANKAILRRMLAESVEENRFGQRMILFTSYSSPWQGMAGLGERLNFRGKADYANYLTRLEKLPAVNDTWLAITERAVREGYAQPCVSMGGVEGAIRGVVADDVAKSRFYAPFARAKPRDATDAEWAALQARARDAIGVRVYPAYRKAADYIRDGYMPSCAKVPSVSAQPRGGDYYRFAVRQQTTTDLTPDAIHAIGLREVARIRAEMEAVAKSAGFATREAFVADLRTNPDYYAKTPDELLAAASRVAKTIDGEMPKLFNRLPRLPYGVRAIPVETAEGTTTAYYGPGSPQNRIAGTYYVNTSKLDQRPLWELPSLTAHEAVPGHHMQIALQQELDLPPLRTRLSHFTAFTEGWGLYAETLGHEIGLYDTPQKRMGRLSYSMWRACRLVVDTGIHAQGWTKERAVAFMRDNTALSAANIDAEVNRYIAWPGQALGYKLGELKILELRAKAEAALGARFELAAFNDAVLEQGSVPLDVLEAHVTAWIAARVNAG